MAKKDAVYEAVTIQTLRIIALMHEIDTDAHIIQQEFIGEIGDYERKLAKREGIEIYT